MAFSHAHCCKYQIVHFVSFHFIHVFLCSFLCPFFWIRKEIFFLVLQFHALQSNYIGNNTRGKRRYGIFLPIFNSICLSSVRSIFHILQVMLRRKILKVVNLGKEIENDKKLNEKKFGPCINVFLNFDPYITLDLFHSKQWLQKRSNIKEIETGKVADRLGNGKMIKKWPMLKANSVLRAKNKANVDQVIW